MRSFSGTLLPVKYNVLPISKKLRAIGFSIKSSFMLTVLSLLISTITFSQNEIVTENAKPGNPSSEWDISGVGDLSIQGFATQMSVNKGETVFFKIRTNSASYSINIYRTGYYNGLGARKWGVGTITTALPQTQPDDLYDPVTGKTDCSNWNVSASWAVPPNAVSGIYYAKLTRNDGSLGSSHIIFIVRNDAGNSDILFKTSDATWQAYNNYGGTSFYGKIFGNDPFKPVAGSLHANKLSYDRPLYSSKYGRDCYKSAEYPMVRWLERNGYNVSYATCVDFAKDNTPMNHLSHKALFAVGHDEYWSATERNKFEQARNAGIHLGFFSGNTCFWKTRWEDNYRTLVCYKEGSETESDLLVCGGKCDLSTEWTGLWRSGCAYPGGGACKPENSLVGQIGSLEGNAAIEVPDTYKNFRFWRNTTIPGLSAGQKAVLSNSTIGYEFENDQYSSSLYANGRINFAAFYPAGRVALSNTTVGGFVHKISMYKYSSGALIFASGSIQWSWGLDGNHDRGLSIPDVRMQQATVNLFADMAIQPTSLQGGLLYTTLAPDYIAPKSVITTNFTGDLPSIGKSYLISGTASDEQGVVASVEISVDGGVTWQIAEGTTNWNYLWIPGVEGNAVIKTRALDDFGNVETPAISSGINYHVVFVLPEGCPCSVFKPTDAPLQTQNDGKPVEAGFKLRATEDGVITKIRFYKQPGTGGYHIGSVWTKDRVKLTSETFTNETASGWQEVALSNPVNITAGITYVASIYNSSGDYVFSRNYFKNYSPGQDVIFGLRDGEDGPNGVGEYALNEPIFPTITYLSSNYFVDVVFNTRVIKIGRNPVSTTFCNETTVNFFSATKSGYMPTVQWQESTDGINWINIQGATNPTLSFLGKTSDNGKKYRAAWTNSAGTIYSAAATLTIKNILVALNSKTDAGCLGNDGSITVGVTGGVEPYYFRLNNGDFKGSPRFDNLGGGLYNVNVKDAIGCTASVTDIIINGVPALSIVLQTKTDVSCKGNNGTLVVDASGGRPTYTYSINSGAFQSSNSFASLVPGVYSVTVMDSKGCISTLSGIEIAQPQPIQLLLSVKAHSNCSQNDGTIAVTASNGIAPYKYSKDGVNFQTSSIFNNLAPGSYIITVKDATGCEVKISDIVIENNGFLAIKFLAKTDATCGLSDGTFSVAGSCGVAPFRYMLSTGIYQTNGTFSNLAPGTYNAYVIDSKSNTAVISDIVIFENKTLAVTASTIVNTTCSNNDGSVTLTAIGGNSPYQYKLDAGTYKTGNTFFGLSTGTYKFTVKDNNGCTTNIAVDVSSAPTNLAIIVTEIMDASCAGGDGYIKVNATGGAGGYVFNIKGGVYGTSKTFRDLKEGIYVVSVKDSKGCITSLGGVEVKRTSFIASLTGVTGISCKGNDGLISISTVGGSAPYLYSANGGKYDNANRVLENLRPDTFYVTVKDALDCISVVRDIVVANAPALSGTSSKTNACKNINNGTITTTVTGGIPPYQFSLSGAGYKTSNVFSNLAPGTYYVRVKDAKGCLFTVSNITITRLTTTCSGRGYEGYVTNTVKTNEVVVEKVIEASAKMSIFPNPTSGNFKLNVKNLYASKANVIIVDALGKEIYKFQTIIRSDSEMLSINLDRIHKGVYFINLSTTKFNSTEKLVIY